LEWLDNAGDLTLEHVLGWDAVIQALEHQAPRYTPGTQHGYHALTYGWLVGELIRRTSGKTVGGYVQEHFADPLGLDLWIGLPESQQSRVANLITGPGGVTGEFDPEDPIMKMLAPFLAPDGVLTKALAGGLTCFGDPDVWNTNELRAAEIPAANGVCDARSLARLYAACVNEVDGVRLLSSDQIDNAVTQRTTGPNSVLLNMDVQFGLGFMLRSSMIVLGGPRSFGHFGAGGSVGWADPDAELAVGYTMNKMAIGLAGDQRSLTLVNACYDALG
jgi:CubicO group peptidase (beta-lactamase class C family)